MSTPDTGLREMLQQQIAMLKDGPEWAAYVAARDGVLAMKDAAPTDSGAPSAYWAEELSGFEYLLDASPLLIQKLRHHSYHVTGLKPYDYRSNKDKMRDRIALKLKALSGTAGGRALLVPESPILGGFGFDLGNYLVNVDTLKYFEVMIGLERAAVLGKFRESADRRLVWEIGAGWGGFPYTFKSLFPNVTYVITDLPELFLFSGTFLATALPGARMAYCTPDTLDDILSRWHEFDFILAPNYVTDVLALPQVDLAINMVSFQEMTQHQVEGYVRRAHELGAAYLYSLNRDRSPYNTELDNVRDIIDRWFWPHPIDVLPVSYTKLPDDMEGIKRPKVKLPKPGAPPDLDYKHVCGWHRLT